MSVDLGIAHDDEVRAPISNIARPIPGGPDTIPQMLKIAATRWPEREALVGRHNRYSYRELADAVDAGAHFLNELGVQKGSRVAATAANDPDIVIAFLATMQIGAIWVGINRVLAAPEKAFLLADSSAELYLADLTAVSAIETLRDELPALKHVVGMDPNDLDSDWRRAIREKHREKAACIEVDPFAPATIAYTSGTTGRPKGAVHSQHNLLVLPLSALWFKRGGQWAPELRRGVVLPLTIVNLMAIGALASIAGGSTCICMDRIDVVGVAEWIEQERVATFAAAPTTIFDLLTHPEVQDFDLTSLTLPTAGGGHVTTELLALYKGRFGVELGTGYGLTEAMAGVAEISPGQTAPAGSCGKAYEHLEIGITRADGSEAGTDEDGEIRIRAIQHGEWANVYTPALGYWQRADDTAALLRDGWLLTGDIGCIDADGFLFIKDRRNDLIIRGGANVYPAEIERIVMQHSAIRACAIIGVPDERLGEQVVAFIELGAIHDRDKIIDDLTSYCAQNLARYKLPQSWHIVDAMPRNSMNKVIKADLKVI